MHSTMKKSESEPKKTADNWYKWQHSFNRLQHCYITVWPEPACYNSKWGPLLPRDGSAPIGSVHIATGVQLKWEMTIICSRLHEHSDWTFIVSKLNNIILRLVELTGYSSQLHQLARLLDSELVTLSARFYKTEMLSHAFYFGVVFTSQC